MILKNAEQNDGHRNDEDRGGKQMESSRLPLPREGCVMHFLNDYLI